jgi:bacterioferritin
VTGDELPARERRPALASDKNAQLIRALNEAMSAEYGALWLLPQHMAQLQDEELRRQLKLIADVELEHAEKSARMILSLGGQPNADLPQLRPRSGAREILEAHVAGEKEAIALYTRALELTDDPKLRGLLEAMKRDEEGHQRLLERALSRL